MMLSVNSMSARKSSYKLPPTTITDKLVSQEARRSKALEEQKRRRALKFDSSRQLDQFADLSLGFSENEEDDVEDETTTIAGLGPVAQFAAMLNRRENSDSIQTHSNPHLVAEDDGPASPPPTTLPNAPNAPKLLSKKHRKKRKSKKKQNKWADRCMYAELLEMAVPALSESSIAPDGLPEDLETGWIAVGPVPKGKRCLAVTQAAAGVSGTIPNTILRSRLLGKILIHRFPSVLPPLTVLDCILDAQWRENGILHVLDVIKWKGQDVSECEAAFRFWWRDMRLTELAESPPPVSHSAQGALRSSHENFTFPYPNTFIAIPYHADTTIPTLLTHIIPAIKSLRFVSVMLPMNSCEEKMEVDLNAYANKGRRDISDFGMTVVRTNAQIEPDGLLLYVKEASYEPGTSPLSTWIPTRGHDAHLHEHQLGCAHVQITSEGPLAMFYQLLQKRLDRARQNVTSDAEMEVT